MSENIIFDVPCILFGCLIGISKILYFLMNKKYKLSQKMNNHYLSAFNKSDIFILSKLYALNAPDVS